MQNKKTKTLFLFLRLAVVAAGIVFVILWLRQNDRWQNLKAIFSQLNPLIFVAVVIIFTIAQFIVALRWWLLLRSQSIFIHLTAAIRLHFLGLFYNNVMPSSLGGDVIRAWYVTHHTEKKFEAALSVFVDRIVGLFSTLAIAVFFYTVFLIPEGKKINFTGKGEMLKKITEYKSALLTLLAAFVIIIVALSVIPATKKILKKSATKTWTLTAKISKKIKNSAVLYCSKPLSILAVFALTVFLQLMVITAFWILGKDIGILASAKYYYVFFTLTWVLGAVPISIGGAVIVEGILAYMFINFAGVEPEAALALALCQRIVWMLTSLPGAAIHLAGAHLPKDISVDYRNNIN
ncbi:MAG: flippase-like domain-containing protein [Planctomycetes bacterium]|nr:flippase-like domain-containing protein [Planctomycetota bacterium]